MKKLKKVLILLIVLLVVAGAALGGISAYQNYQKENLQAETVLVSDLNYFGGFDDEMSSQGYVSNNFSQSIQLQDKTVSEVMVEQGQEVKIGDPLLVYDTTDSQLAIEMKQLEIQGIQNDITLKQRELEKLRKITPTPNVSPTAPKKAPVKQNTTKKEKDKTVVIMKVQKKDGNAYNYIDHSAMPFDGEGTPEKPFRFLCTQECYVMGSFLNQLAKEEQTASFEIWSGNSYKKGTLLSCWTVDGTDLKKVDDDSKWLVFTHEEMEDEIELEEEEEEDDTEEEPEEEEDDNDNDSTETEYTADELRSEITEAESDLAKLNIDKRRADMEMEKLQKEKDSATVLASINGVVSLIADPQNPPTDGSAFMEVTDSEGMYVRGQVSELNLDQIEVGQEISITSWSNGQTYTAEITEVSDYPVDSSNGYYGEGNPNVSYYSFTGYIEESEGLTSEDSVELSITPASTEETSFALYIEKAYVREENGMSYVMKVDENNRLMKQYVQTGKTLYGSAIEIKAGLSETDRVAFPYGKTAKEGIKAVESESE